MPSVDEAEAFSGCELAKRCHVLARPTQVIRRAGCQDAVNVREATLLLLPNAREDFSAMARRAIGADLR
jgi:hypothetical protein